MCRISCIQLLALSASVFLSACGGGGGSEGGNTTPPSPSTGVFVDSPVAGLHYATPSRSGTTNALGEYEYLPSETVTFSIGGIVLGSTLAGPVVSPLSLVAGATDATNPIVTNIVRLLMTLDDDGDASNGIVILSATATAVAGHTVDFTAADLAADPGMIALLPGLPGTPALVDTTAAQMHFAATLATHSNWGSLAWGGGTWKSKTP